MSGQGRGYSRCQSQKGAEFGANGKVESQLYQRRGSFLILRLDLVLTQLYEGTFNYVKKTTMLRCVRITSQSAGVAVQLCCG